MTHKKELLAFQPLIYKNTHLAKVFVLIILYNNSSCVLLSSIELMEQIFLGGIAAASAGAICNPLEVVKIRMQLQGELLAKGKYTVHYKNVFHAAYTIATKDGLLALQKGLTPFVCYQFTVNTARLGLYQVLVNKGLTKDSQGRVSTPKTLICAISCGTLGGFLCSPFYLIKTHLQSKTNEASIAVGYQHQHEGMIQALVKIFKEEGIPGLWRGTTSNILRIAAASAGQILTFEKAHEYLKDEYPGSTWKPLCLASLGAGFFMALTMAPFDIIATRFYNQGTHQGKGLLYNSVVDCAAKIYREEGLLAFYKGLSACYFRLGPYSVLLLIFWDRLKHLNEMRINNKKTIPAVSLSTVAASASAMNKETCQSTSIRTGEVGLIRDKLLETVTVKATTTTR